MRLRYRQSPFWTYTHTCSSIVGLEPRLDRGHDEALGFCEPGNHSRGRVSYCAFAIPTGPATPYQEPHTL